MFKEFSMRMKLTNIFRFAFVTLKIMKLKYRVNLSNFLFLTVALPKLVDYYTLTGIYLIFL